MNVEEYVHISLNIKEINKYIYYGLDLTQSHIMILYLVLNSEKQKLDLQELCEKTQTVSSVITRQIKDLEKRGYLMKKRYENNLRKAYVFMSQEQKEDTVALIDLIEEYIKKHSAV